MRYPIEVLDEHRGYAQVALDEATARLTAAEAAHEAALADVEMLKVRHDALTAAIARVDPHPPVRKCIAGHALALNIHEQGIDVLAHAARPGLYRVQRRAYWRDLEGRPGDYSPGYRFIERDLDECERLGIPHYALQILSHRTYVKGLLPCPADLAEHCTAYTSGHPEGKTIEGMTYHWWGPDEYLTERLIAVYEAMARRFDAHPIFSGLASEETATGLTDAQEEEAGYTAERAMVAIDRLVRRVTSAMPACTFDLYMNYLPKANTRMIELARSLADVEGWRWGGPDVLPDNAGLGRWLYPQMREVGDEVRKFLCMQHTSINLNRHADNVAFAREIGVEALYWNDDPRAGTSGPYAHALDYVAENPL